MVHVSARGGISQAGPGGQAEPGHQAEPGGQAVVLYSPSFTLAAESLLLVPQTGGLNKESNMPADCEVSDWCSESGELPVSRT